MTTKRLRTAEVALVLGVSKSTVRRMVLRGDLIPARDGRGRGRVHEFDVATMRPVKRPGDG